MKISTELFPEMDGWINGRMDRMMMKMIKQMVRIGVGITTLLTHLVPAANAEVASVSIPSQFIDASVAAFRIRCCSSCCSVTGRTTFRAAISISLSSSFVLHTSCCIGDDTEEEEDVNLFTPDDKTPERGRCPMEGRTFLPCSSLVAVALSKSVNTSRISSRR